MAEEIRDPSTIKASEFSKPCSKCGGTDYWKSGHERMESVTYQRFKCKKCKHVVVSDIVIGVVSVNNDLYNYREFRL